MIIFNPFTVQIFLADTPTKFVERIMESKVAIQSLVFIALFSYFTCKIIAAKNKLDAQKVGELRSEKTEDTVQGHTNCY